MKRCVRCHYRARTVKRLIGVRWAGYGCRDLTACTKRQIRKGLRTPEAPQP